MAKFKQKGSKGTPGISTASLPDIIFMLLFGVLIVLTGGSAIAPFIYAIF